MKLDYYNAAHLLMVCMSAVLFCIIFFSLRRRSAQTKSKALFIILVCNAVLFVVYKVVMGFTFSEFILLNELPLHLCNFSVILLPIAIKTKNRYLCSYLYYVGSLAALAGVLFFDTFFLYKNVFNFVVFSYFFYHSILMTAGILIPALNIYTPKFVDIFGSIMTLAVISLCMHTVNSIFRITKICTIANYYYTYGLEGNPILGKLYQLIPVPVLYQSPLLIVVIALNICMYLPFAKRLRIMEGLRREQLAVHSPPPSQRQ